MELFLNSLLAYFIGLAANERTSAIVKRREAKLNKQLKDEEALRKTLASCSSLRNELSAACVELARNRGRLRIKSQEIPIWNLLSDDVFQADVAEWLMAGGIEEGDDVKQRLLQTMEGALKLGGANPAQILFLKTDYFEALDKMVFAHPTLAHWRHQLSLDHLREQVAVLRDRADEAAGVYSAKKQRAAVDRYCKIALDAWDIIELSNLPEGDVDIVAQKLLLRQLYMPLRIQVEPTDRAESVDVAEGIDGTPAKILVHGDARRRLEAGRGASGEPDASRAPVGERLDVSRRLVVLGDPGGGKTTMLRWMATAYLLQYMNDDAYSQIPDTSTLPDHHWIPVLIRCRDIGPEDLSRCFADFLKQHLHKSELQPEDANVMQAVILDRMAKGAALLLVDGLDEITDPNVRMMFCQELERTSARYPDAPIVVTSRIVGYRDMPYRMGSGFEHGVIADLNRSDKDLFARRWINVTEQHQTTDEKTKRTNELIDAFHSSDRIERLTGNPMLLTTMALVKRKVGKLPNKRTKLYREAVSVLLNWNPRYHDIIEEDEAIPQLEYIAYAMCQRGVQRLTEDDLLDLLDKLREEYPNIREVTNRKPKVFLDNLEARSSILIKSGSIWDKNKTQDKAAWEFRHLTFQEYLAARALIDGRYPNRDKKKSLAEQVAALAGAVEADRNRSYDASPPEMQVPESWREALRLVVADCRYDDVDSVLLAILNPIDGENTEDTARPRAVLAALCLADEPDISNAVAESIIAAFVGTAEGRDGGGGLLTTVDIAAHELRRSIWAKLLKKYLIEEFSKCSPNRRNVLGGLFGMVEVAGWEKLENSLADHFEELVRGLNSGVRNEQLSAALSLMSAAYDSAAYEEKAVLIPGIIDGLLAMLKTDSPRTQAAAWALGWLSGGFGWTEEPKAYWLPSETEVANIVTVFEAKGTVEYVSIRWLSKILVRGKNKQAVKPLVAWLDDPDEEVRRAVASALGELGFKESVKPLIERLDDPDEEVRRAVASALGELGFKESVKPLIERLDDPDEEVRRAVASALGELGFKEGVKPLIDRLDDPDVTVRRAVASALGELGFKESVKPLIDRLDDPHASVRREAVSALAKKRSKTDRILLSEDLDGLRPGIDPREPISSSRNVIAGDLLNITPEEVRTAYVALAPDFHLTIEQDED